MKKKKRDRTQNFLKKINEKYREKFNQIFKEKEKKLF